MRVNPKYLRYYNFYKEAFKILEPQTPYVHNWHTEFICDALQAETYRIKRGGSSWGDIIINIPFRSGKSYVTTVIYPVWSWIVNPAMAFLTVSYSDSLATKHSRDSRTIIESDWFQEEFGSMFRLRLDQNAKSYYANDKGGERFATGIEASATGMGGDVIIVDDGQNPKKARSEKERKTTNREYRETFYSRTRNPKTAVRIIVMQRLHEMDLTGSVLKIDKNVRRVCVPAELSEKVPVIPERLRSKYRDGLFWPERFGRKELDDTRTMLGSMGYASQMLQIPSPAEGSIFKKSWFDIVDQYPDGLTWNFAVDGAYTSDKERDATALLAYAYDGKNYYFRKAEHVWLEFPQLCRYLALFVSENGYTRGSKIYVEPKASGKSIVQQMKETTGLNILESKPPRDSKEQRANAVSPIIEAGRVKLVLGSWNEEYLDELAMFPKGRLADQVDVTVMALSESGQSNEFVML